MNGISKRIFETFRKLHEGDLENALLQVCLAIDATAKNKYGKKTGVGARFRKLIDDNEQFIRFVHMGGKTYLLVTGDLKFADRGKISNVVYKYMRNPLVHEGDSTSNIAFSTESKIGHEGEKFIVNHYLIWGLALVVVGDSTNDNCNFDEEIEILIDEVELKINSLWGSMDNIKQAFNYREISYKQRNTDSGANEPPPVR